MPSSRLPNPYASITIEYGNVGAGIPAPNSWDYIRLNSLEHPIEVNISLMSLLRFLRIFGLISMKSYLNLVIFI